MEEKFIQDCFEDKAYIDKIRTNSHDLNSQIGYWTKPKTQWEESVS
jgi:hypothetical protein